MDNITVENIPVLLVALITLTFVIIVMYIHSVYKLSFDCGRRSNISARIWNSKKIALLVDIILLYFVMSKG